jgi:hypothetical protein
VSAALFRLKAEATRKKRIFIAELLQSSVEAAASTPDHERASPKLGDGEKRSSVVEYSGTS